jgi:hypothetical protein
MITLGFVPSYSDAVTIGQFFFYNGVQYTATYIFVGSAGDIVWENNQGEPQWFPGAQANQGYIMGAGRILASGVVNGVSRTTTASSMTWMSATQRYNTP